MLEAAPPTPAGDESTSGHRPGSVLSKLVRRPTGLIGVVFLTVVIAAAILAPVLAPHDVASQNLQRTLEGPSSEFWLGTDDLGRDMLSRLLYGARASLFGALLAVTIATVVGVALGLVAGYVGGRVEQLIMRGADVILSIPGFVVAISLVGVLGPSLTNAMFAVGVIYIPVVCRLMRAQARVTVRLPFVESARVLRFGHLRIMVRHVLPNSISPVLIQVPMLLSLALLAESSLSFLGFGVQPPSPSWGQMLSRGQNAMLRSQWQVMPAGLAILATSLSFAFVSEGLRSVLDPHAHRRNRRSALRERRAHHRTEGER